MDGKDLKMDFDPQKARSMRVKHRIKNEVDLDVDDDDGTNNLNFFIVDDAGFSKNELKHMEEKDRDDDLGEDEIKK